VDDGFDDQTRRLFKHWMMVAYYMLGVMLVVLYQRSSR